MRPVPILTDATEIAAYVAEVEKVAEMWLLQQLNSSTKLYLIHQRLEIVGKRKTGVQVPLKMRTYLTCPVSKYRDALQTSMVFSTHKLAVERLRWADRGRRCIACDQQLCRLRTLAVEPPEHVCNGSGYISQMYISAA